MNHRIATPEDLPLVLSLMREFYEEEGLIFEAARAEQALKALLQRSELGQVLLFSDADAHGFMVLIVGFTLEHGGPYILLDELYLQPPMRGRGLGKAAMELAKAYAVLRGIKALRLEVHHHNPAAKALYAKAGFQDDHRDLMTLWL